MNLTFLNKYLEKSETRETVTTKTHKTTKNQELKDQDYITILTPDLINPITKDTEKKQESWNVLELKTFFRKVDFLEIRTLQLNEWTKISDVKTFVVNHLSVCRQTNGNKTFKAYFDRLQELKKVIEAKEKKGNKITS